MATEILMPALSPTMEDGTLSRWLVKEGDRVTTGDILAEIETDKATMEFEAADEGRLGRILVPEGTEGVRVNTPIAVLVAPDETLDPAAVAPGAGAAFEEAVTPGAARQPAASKPAEGQPAASKPAAGQPAASKPAAGQPAASKPAAGRPTAGQPAGGRRARPREGDAAQGDGRATRSTAGQEAAARSGAEWPDGTPVKPTTLREALRDAMAEEMRRDDAVFLMGEEVAEYQGAYKISQGLFDEFGRRRVIDTPITEHGFAGIAVGAAFGGLKPIVEFMTWNFAMQAIDQIVNSAAKTLYMSGGRMGCPIVFRGPNGAAARVGAQHSQDFAAWYAHVPGLKVAVPYCASDAKGLLKSAIRDPNPVVFLENEILYGQSHDVPQIEDYTVPFGKARIWREGGDVTLVSFGIGMTYALEAARRLSEDGIAAEVVDLRTLRPMDMATVIASVRKTNRCVTIEEGWPVGAIGAQISSVLMEQAFDWLDAPVRVVTGADVPMPYAASLERHALPTADAVVAAAKSVCYR